MNTRPFLIFALPCVLVISSCNTLEVQDSIEDLYMTGGAALGGVLGSQIAGSGSRTQGAIIGTLIGGFVGRTLGRYLAEQDRRHLANATSRTASTGKAQSWSNPETKVSGKTAVVKTTTKKKTVRVPVLKDRIAQVPPLDMNKSGTYRAQSTVNVRGGPGTDYKQVGRISAGESVSVIGKVDGKTWYLIEDDGVGSGFVYANALRRQSASSASKSTKTMPKMALGSKLPLFTSSDVKQTTVTSTTRCRTIQQTVKLADGSTKQDDITACEGPNGWEAS